jgi:hypothetical protein
MAKRRKYGDAWKDVQIDAEQNDAVFDRFFKRTQPEPEQPPERAGALAPPPPPPPSAGKSSESSAPRRDSTPTARTAKTPQAKASVRPITPTLPNISGDLDIAGRVDTIKRLYRLSKGEAAVLKYLLERAGENGGFECYAKIPLMAEASEMTHRGCQFALRSLEARTFIIRLKDYDPADRLGIRFQINLPSV